MGARAPLPSSSLDCISWQQSFDGTGRSNLFPRRRHPQEKEDDNKGEKDSLCLKMCLSN